MNVLYFLDVGSDKRGRKEQSYQILYPLGKGRPDMASDAASLGSPPPNKIHHVQHVLSKIRPVSGMPSGGVTG